MLQAINSPFSLPSLSYFLRSIQRIPVLNISCLSASVPHGKELISWMDHGHCFNGHLFFPLLSFNDRLSFFCLTQQQKFSAIFPWTGCKCLCLLSISLPSPQRYWSMSNGTKCRIENPLIIFSSSDWTFSEKILIHLKGMAFHCHSLLLTSSSSVCLSCFEDGRGSLKWIWCLNYLEFINGNPGVGREALKHRNQKL